MCIRDRLEVFNNQPVFFLLLALVLTYLSYSSLAIVLLSVSFLASGVIGLNEGLYLVLGANLGSGMLPLISSWNSSESEKNPIIANLLVRSMCIIIFYPFVSVFSSISIGYISAELIPAIYHLSLNVIVAIIGLIFSKQFLALSVSLFSENNIENQFNKHNILESDDFAMPAVSLANAKREALRMAEVSQNMVCLLYTSPSPRDKRQSRMPSSA